jgi:hypothetical protein
MFGKPTPQTTSSTHPSLRAKSLKKTSKLVVKAECVCSKGYSGTSCEHVACPGDGTCGAKSGHGICNQMNGLCACISSYGGDTCDLKLCPGMFNDCKRKKSYCFYC